MNSSSNQSLIKSTDRKVSMPIGDYSEIEMFQVANFYPVIELNNSATILFRTRNLRPANLYQVYAEYQIRKTKFNDLLAKIMFATL